MRFPAARLLSPLLLATTVTASRADTLPNIHHYRVHPVSSTEAPVPVPKPQAVTATPAPAAPPTQVATPAPVVPPDATPPTQTVGVGGVPPSPTQPR